jgi:hypothetical protein
VHNYRNQTKADSVFTDPQRKVPFRVRLRTTPPGTTDTKEEWFAGEVGPKEKVTCLEWDHAGTGALGRMVMLPAMTQPGTFAEMCAAVGATYTAGQGYYAVIKTEKVSEKKDMMLRDDAADTFEVGATSCRARLGLGAGPIKVAPKMIPAGHTLYVQSTSHNRKIPAGVSAVMMLPSVREALLLRRGAAYPSL